MHRALSFLAALGSTWLWYGGLRVTRQLAEPMLSSQASLYASLGAVLPLPTRMWLKLDDLHIPLFAAVVTTVVLIVIERIFESPMNRDLVHSLTLALLLSYLVFSTVAILMALGNVIGKIG